MHDDGPIPGAVIVLVVLFFFYVYVVANAKVESVTIIKNGADTVLLNSENESPYFKLALALTDDKISLPETRISNYFWLYESEGYILVDGDVWFFFVKEGRPNVVIELSEFPFESPPWGDRRVFKLNEKTTVSWSFLKIKNIFAGYKGREKIPGYKKVVKLSEVYFVYSITFWNFVKSKNKTLKCVLFSFLYLLYFFNNFLFFNFFLLFGF